MARKWRKLRSCLPLNYGLVTGEEKNRPCGGERQRCFQAPASVILLKAGLQIGKYADEKATGITPGGFMTLLEFFDVGVLLPT